MGTSPTDHESAAPGSADPDPGYAEPGPADDAVVDRRGRFGTSALTLAVVVGLVLGYAAGWLSPRLTAPGNDSAEAGFTRDMTTHHAQAVEMGLVAHQRGTSEIVRRIAAEIITGQQGEIGMMQGWLQRWDLEPTGSAAPMAWMPEGMRDLGPDGLMPGLASQAEMTRLRDGRPGNDLDVLFLQLMIRHHLGGIHMIDAALEIADDPEVRRVAEVMKQTQRSDLDLLQTELTRLGGRPLPAN